MPEFYNGMYPKPRGATDYMDSAHLIGVMIFVGQDVSIDILRNYHIGRGFLVRCPVNCGSSLQPLNTYNFTRDQLISLLSAFYIKNQYEIIHKVIRNIGWRMWNTDKDAVGTKKKFPDGPDILDPSHFGYLRILNSKKPLFFQKAWMLLKILVNSKFTPLKEPNNIIIMSYYYGYLDLLKRLNPQLKQAINGYWNGWRGEPEIAQALCKKVGL